MLELRLTRKGLARRSCAGGCAALQLEAIEPMVELVELLAGDLSDCLWARGAFSASSACAGSIGEGGSRGVGASNLPVSLGILGSVGSVGGALLAWPCSIRTAVSCSSCSTRCSDETYELDYRP